MQGDLQESYHLLEVEIGAPLEDVKRAYRELVKVWHPDRFAHDPKLQRKAQEKLKQINLAYELICKCDSRSTGSRPQTEPSEATSRGARPQAQPPRPGASPGSTHGPQRSAPSPQPSTAPQKNINWGRRFVKFAVLVVILAVLKAGLFPGGHFQRPNAVSQLPYQTSTPDQNNQPPVVQQPAKVSERHFDPNEPVEVVAAPSAPAGSVAQQQTAGVKNLASASGSDTAPAPTLRTYFTVGSTKDEVLAVQGTPNEFTETVFSYPYGSEVYFANGRVTSWKIVASPLKAKLLPTAAAENRGFFTVGSTKDEVLVVQGTPNEFTDTIFSYPYGSEVYFENDRVTSWKIVASPLKAKLLPTVAAENRGFFTVGSTKDEVLIVQGTPNEFTNTVFSYPYGSEVYFANGRVTSWKIAASPLKAKLLPMVAAENRGFFTVGSTKDEVLVVQGTPNEFTDAVFSYPYGSEVYFENGRVTSWKVGASPLKAKLEK